MSQQDDMNDRDPQISELWREAAHGEPPAALDARILAAARQAVQAPASQPKRRNWWKLLVPLSTTAVLVLALSVALRVEKAGQFNEAPAPATAMSPAPAAAPAPASPAADMAAPAAAPRPEKRTMAEARVPADRQPFPAASEPTRNAPAPASPAPAPALTMADKAAGPSGNLTAGAPMALEKQASVQAEASMPDSARQAKVSAARSAAPSPAARPAPLIPPGEMPAATVERIRRLLKDGRTDEARRTLAELRARQPGFVVPEDLRELR